LDDFNQNSEIKGSFIKSIPPLVYVVLVLCIIFFLYQIIGGALALVSIGKEIDSNIPLTRVILSFGQFMLILAPTIFFARLQSPDIKNTFRLKLPKLSVLLLAIIGIILLQPLIQGFMHLQNYLMDNIPFFSSYLNKAKEFFDVLEETTIKIVKSYSVLEFIIVTFVIAFTPAICEEMLFRGFVLKNLEKFSKPAVTIFLSGFLFAVYHFQPFNIIPLIILGSYLGFVVYYSDSIFTGMAVHFLNNFFAAYYLFLYGKDEFDIPEINNSQVLNYLVISVISIIFLAIILYLIYRSKLKTITV
jgi:uncharacterized protein